MLVFCQKFPENSFLFQFVDGMEKKEKEKKFYVYFITFSHYLQ